MDGVVRRFKGSLLVIHSTTNGGPKTAIVVYKVVQPLCTTSLIIRINSSINIGGQWQNYKLDEVSIAYFSGKRWAEMLQKWQMSRLTLAVPLPACWS